MNSLCNSDVISEQLGFKDMVFERKLSLSHSFPVLSADAMMESSSLRTDLMIFAIMENSDHENQKDRERLKFCHQLLSNHISPFS